MDLNHTIVPSHDKVAAAAWIADILGLTLVPPTGHFVPVRVNPQLTLDFDDAETVAHHHYAFHVSDEEFDGIFERVRSRGIKYGSGPQTHENMEINHRREGRGFYFRDADGHSWEVLTR
jgi:catechol 2,3-dioxygenase-like lactoylglutathione lyase family enzyme